MSTPATTVTLSACPCAGVYVQVSRRIGGGMAAGGASTASPNSSRNSSTVSNRTRIRSPRVGHYPCRLAPWPAEGRLGLGRAGSDGISAQGTTPPVPVAQFHSLLLSAWLDRRPQGEDTPRP